MISRRILALAFLTTVVVPMLAVAHDHAPAQDVAVTNELMAFRTAMKAAVEAKDAAKLKAMYTETFTHTHGSGKVDGRDARICSRKSR